MRRSVNRKGRKKTALLAGGIALALLVAIAFMPSKSPVPQLEITEGLKDKGGFESEYGLFASVRHMDPQDNQGFPTASRGSLYEPTMPADRVLASLTEQLGKPSSSQISDVASNWTWKFSSGSYVRMHVVRVQKPETVMVVVQARRPENFAGIIKRMFRNGLHP
jgi:hypothetical protein